MNKNKISKIVTLIGILFLVGGLYGVFYTSKNIKQEKIITPEDASIPNKLVKGPFTLKSQAEVIRKHTLSMTDGKTYAEMPRQISKLDEGGQVILGEDGNPIMVANTARDIWITSTTLTNALNLGILAYMFSIVVLLNGLVLIILGCKPKTN